MLTIHIRKGTIGEDGIATYQVPHTPHLTPRSLAQMCSDRLPATVAIDIGLNGKLCTDEDYDKLVEDGDTLILVPSTTYGIDLYAMVVYAIISAVARERRGRQRDLHMGRNPNQLRPRSDDRHRLRKACRRRSSDLHQHPRQQHFNAELH